MDERIVKRIEQFQEKLEDADFSKDEKIDIHALEVEWAGQTAIYKRWSNLLAEAKKLVNILTEQQEIRKAKIDKGVRREPSKYNLDKATNEAINSIVILDKDYREITDSLIDMKFAVDLLFGSIIALEHRRDALKNEVSLYNRNYYMDKDESEGLYSKSQERENYLDQEQRHRRKINESARARRGKRD